MSETRFTPGPWLVTKNPVNWHVKDVRRRYIVENVRPLPERDANAHLIAAAPDLYAALALCEQHFRRNQVSGNSQSDDKHEAWRVASAALAKARGEA